jgi:hypothetical protein
MRITVEIATPSMAIVGHRSKLLSPPGMLAAVVVRGYSFSPYKTLVTPVFSLSSQESPTGLAPGNSKTVTFTLIPTQAGTAQLGVLLSYERPACYKVMEIRFLFGRTAQPPNPSPLS